MSARPETERPLHRIIPCRAPLSVKFLPREALEFMLSRQGLREGGGRERVEAAFLGRYDGTDPHFRIIGAFWRERLLGVTSFGVIENPNIRFHGVEDPENRRHYARVDAVAVDPGCRRCGVGRWLVGTNLRYLLAAWPGRLYSISTIAAHRAIARIFGSYGFEVAPGVREGEQRVSCEIGAEGERRLAALVRERIEREARRVFFRLRQRENAE